MRTYGFLGTSRTTMARASVAVVALAAVAIAALNTGRSAALSLAPTTTGRAHIGPMSVETGNRVVLAVTNVADGRREATLKLFDQDGAAIATKEISAPPGETRLLGLHVTTSDIHAVRGGVQVLFGDGSVREFRASLSIMDGLSNTIMFWEHLIDLGRLFEGRATTALLHLGHNNPIGVHVANLGRQEADYRVRFLNREGEVVASERLSSVAPGATESATFDPAEPAAVRAEVVPLDGGRYLASGFLSAPTSGFLSVEFQETRF